MKMWKEKTWQHEATGPDGHVALFGVSIFDYQWRDTGRKAKVRHPLYPDQTYKFPIYTVTLGDAEQEFAAGEFSSCVWGFYVYKF